jgi:hypothetical protein
MVFNNKKDSPVASYHLSQAPLDIVDETRYLGVTLQSDLKFNKLIRSKIAKAQQQLGMIKRALFDAPEHARLIAYTSLCPPNLEYASSVWDPVSKKLDHDIEMVQRKGLRFMRNIKGRHGVTEAMEQIGLQPLSLRRKTNRRNLLLRLLLSKEEHFKSLISAYEELTNDRLDHPTTRSTSRGDPHHVETHQPYMLESVCIITASCQKQYESLKQKYSQQTIATIMHHRNYKMQMLHDIRPILPDNYKMQTLHKYGPTKS